MHPLERVPAIRRVDTDRPGLFAIEITGEVTSADVENLFGLLEGAYALQDRLDLLVRIREFGGLLSEGMSSATTYEVKEHARGHVKRCALIGASNDIAEVKSFLRLPSAVELREFGPDDEPDAWLWFGARELT